MADRVFDHSRIDDVIHSRLRLSIMAVLATLERAEFTFLRDRIGATDGNLSVHLRRLEEAGYLTITKHFIARKPRTECALTAEGRSAFKAYVEHLGRLVGTGGPTGTTGDTE
ncbi:MAG: transcriptional regulator [Steroidobacteraceae bacterium]